MSNYAGFTDADLIVKVADCIEAISWARMWCHPLRVDEVLNTVVRKYNVSTAELNTRYAGALEVVAGILREVSE
jgi:hypothetical protein